MVNSGTNRSNIKSKINALHNNLNNSYIYSKIVIFALYAYIIYKF